MLVPTTHILKPEDYNSRLENLYIRYLDANNLCGWSMSQYLSVDGFKFLEQKNISKIDFTKHPDDS